MNNNKIVTALIIHAILAFLFAGGSLVAFLSMPADGGVAAIGHLVIGMLLIALSAVTGDRIARTLQVLQMVGDLQPDHAWQIFTAAERAVYARSGRMYDVRDVARDIRRDYRHF